VLGFAAAFLKYLAQVRVDPRYLSFTLFLERPKATRVKKAITEQIVTREDIASLFNRIDVYAEMGKISPQKHAIAALMRSSHLTQDYGPAQSNA
jgi:hypothetical protein